MSSTTTKIEWCDATWNPTRGCSRVSPGCVNCYAERQAIRHAGPGGSYEGLARSTDGGPRWTGKLVLVEEALAEPLRWRKPRRIFVNSMSDLFHEGLSDEDIDRVFATMALAPHHTFQVLTKRADRMQRWFRGVGQVTRRDFVAAAIGRTRDVRMIPPFPWPLPNLWLGVSAEDQQRAKERLPLLASTPAAVRFVSVEPLLGMVDLELALCSCPWPADAIRTRHVASCIADQGRLDWAIFGGESGPKARPCHPGWIRVGMVSARKIGAAVYVKQLGAWQERQPERYCQVSRNRYSHESVALFADGTTYKSNEPDTWGTRGMVSLYRHTSGDKKGGDPTTWPDALRVREFPTPRTRT